MARQTGAATGLLEEVLSGLDALIGEAAIAEAKREIESPLKEEQLGRLQPKWIKQGDKKWVVDFRSPATITNFGYDEETKTMQFSFELLAEIRIYASSDILPEKLRITIFTGRNNRLVCYSFR